METYEFIVSGRVQGVGYRYFVTRVADTYHVKGNVRNLSDGRVKIIIQADPQQYKDFIAAIQVPQHRFMRIEKVDVRILEEPQSFHNFKIIY